MQTESVSYELRDDVAWIKLDDGGPNVYNLDVFAAIDAVIDQADEDEAKALVLTGREGYFSAGMDLKWMQGSGMEVLAEIGPALGKLAHRLFIYRRPTLAAVTGHSIAGGAILMLACDRTIAVSGKYKFGLTEVALGIPFGGFGWELASFHLTPSAIARGLMHGETFGTEEAQRVGFLDEVVSPDEFDQKVAETAARLAGLSDFAYPITKQLMRGEAAKRIETDVNSDEMREVFKLMGAQ